jgi:hypothetical protein
MAKDNVTPIGPHVTVPTPADSAQLEAAIAKMSERVEAQRGRIFQAMGVISCAAAAAPCNVAEGDPDIRFALRAAHSLLDAVCTELDPSYFELEEVANG